jgi:hypothetical protein
VLEVQADRFGQHRPFQVSAAAGQGVVVVVVADGEHVLSDDGPFVEPTLSQAKDSICPQYAVITGSSRPSIGRLRSAHLTISRRLASRNSAGKGGIELDDCREGGLAGCGLAPGVKG